MLSNRAWTTVDDIQSEVDKRIVENKPSKSQGLPFARYLHVADTAYTHGSESFKKNELDRTYYYYYFYVSLIIQVLPKHPGYDTTSDRYLEAKKRCVELLDRLQPLKEKLRALYEEQRAKSGPVVNGELVLPSVPRSDPGEQGIGADELPTINGNGASQLHNHTHTHNGHAHTHNHSSSAKSNAASGPPPPELKLPLLTALTAMPKNVIYEETHCCTTMYPTGRMIRSNLTIVRPAPPSLPPVAPSPSPTSLSASFVSTPQPPPLVSTALPSVPSTSLSATTVPHLATPSSISPTAPPMRVPTPEPPPSFTDDTPLLAVPPPSFPSAPVAVSTGASVPQSAVVAATKPRPTSTASSTASIATSVSAVTASPSPSSSSSSLSPSSPLPMPVTPLPTTATGGAQPPSTPTTTTSSSSTSSSSITPAVASATTHAMPSPAVQAAAHSRVAPSSSNMPSTTSTGTGSSTTSAAAAVSHPSTAAPLPMPSATLAPPLATASTKLPQPQQQQAPTRTVAAVPAPIRKPKRLTSDGLRNVVLFAPMFVDFMAAAERNTRWAVETCGILAGVESDDGTIFITHLIIPKQIGKSDSVVTTHEEEVFMFQEQHGLLTFGWIHTHPTHDLFMSSVDLHTHYSYQSMMREAIAIVIAPLRSPNFGIFRLTEPDGMHEIGSCSDRGFHPHSGRETLYKVCEHTTLEWGEQHRSRYRVIDQRNA